MDMKKYWKVEYIYILFVQRKFGEKKDGVNEIQIDFSKSGMILS